MLFRSLDNSMVSKLLPRTTAALADWNPAETELPPEEVYRAALADIKEGAEAKTINRVGQRLNYEQTGASSLFRRTARKVLGTDLDSIESAKEHLIGIDRKWGSPDIWKLTRIYSDELTLGYYLSALDMQYSLDGKIERRSENKRIYMSLLWRTLLLSALITLFTFLLGYPVAYLLAMLPSRISNLLMILVLLPFWTSLLVRTTSWIVLLQNKGVMNDLLVTLGLVDNDDRLQMIHNATGTLIAMTHILLPFMILPLYSVMRTIPPSYVRAARSLGANSFRGVLENLLPQLDPGDRRRHSACVHSRARLLHHPRPGRGRPTACSSATKLRTTSRRRSTGGLAAALGTILLTVVLVFFYVYDKAIGFDNLKLG